MKTRFTTLLAILAISICSGLAAQNVPSLSNAQGTSPQALYLMGEFDNVNPVNGNLYLSIPLVSYPQLGRSLKMDLRVFYNGNVWFARWYQPYAAAWDYQSSGHVDVGAYVARSQALSQGSDFASFEILV